MASQMNFFVGASDKQSAIHPMRNLLAAKSSSIPVKCGCVVRNSLPWNVAIIAQDLRPAAKSMTHKERQELLWQQFFLNPLDWWDNRVDKQSPRHPDFRHKTSEEPLWLNSPRKPAWVDSELARWDVEMRGLPALDAGNVDDGNAVEKSLIKRCEEAELGEAVKALNLLVQRGYSISHSVFYRILKRCVVERDLGCGRLIHALVQTGGYGSNAFVANHIIGMYASHGELEDAVQVFRNVIAPSAHMWSSIILAHVRLGQPAQGIQLYQQMKEAGVKADNRVFVSALKACALAGDLVSGKQVHVDIPEGAEQEDVFLATSLVSMYAKCGSLVEARKVFDGLRRKNVVTWNAMITGYSQQGLGREALALYEIMQHEGMTPADHVTFVCLLQACASAGALQLGKQVHLQIRARGLEGDGRIGNCLVDMYAKCGRLDDARVVFDNLLTKDVVSWNAMIAGYVQQGLGHYALTLYASMREEGISVASLVTFSCLLQACADVGALQQGKQLHSEIRERGLEGDVFISSCLVDMYSKCGTLEDAREVFDSFPTRDVVTWTALLNGYAEHGDGLKAIHCFEEMLKQGIKPNDTTFLCLLVACSHAGLVQEGQKYFNKMIENHGIRPNAYHYSCMVDLLARSGQLDEAEHMLRTSAFVNNVVGWKALLSACKSHGDAERGKRCFDYLVQLDPEDASAYVLLGNICANAGRWNDVSRIESLRKSVGAWKKAGKACIEVRNEVHEFTVGEDRSDISSKLRSVNTRLKEEGGHLPRTELVLKAVSEQEKEDALCGHAEKLALAYGLLNTPDGETLLVTKNLRMCEDCHSSTKIMSRLECREIIVRDAHRVHRFLDGSCSCGDRH